MALRTEIEALRAKTRDQTALIARLQALVARAGPAAEAADDRELATASGDAMPSGQGRRAGADRPPKAAAAAGGGQRGRKTPDAQTQAEMRRLKSANQDQAAEISRLKAALATYEAADQDDRGVKDSKIAMKARLQRAEGADRTSRAATIQSLRAEIAAGNERLARQAAYFMEEMRRLGSGTVPASGPARRCGAGCRARQASARRPHQRSARRPARAQEASEEPAADRQRAGGEPRRVSGFLKALDGDAAAEPHAEHASGTRAAAGGRSDAAGDRSSAARRGCSIASPASTRTRPELSRSPARLDRRCDA